MIDIKNAEIVSITHICDSVSYLPLGSSDVIPIPEIIKPYNKYIFIFASGTNQIFLIDKIGNIVNVLNKRGRGPNEYSDIGTFTYDPNKEHLIIHSRNTQELIRYMVPEFEFLDRWKTDVYFNSLTSLSDGRIIGIRETDKNSIGAIEILELDTKNRKKLPIETNTGSIEISADQTFSISDGGSVYYTQPGTDTRVLKFIDSQRYKEEYYLNFGKYGIPEKYWKENSDVDYGEILFEGHHAAMVHFFIDQDDMFSFWFVTSDKNDYTQLYIYDKKTEKKRVIKRINMPGYAKAIIPLGANNHFYVACVYNHFFDMDMGSDIDQNLRDIVKHNTVDQPILLFFRLKNFI